MSRPFSNSLSTVAGDYVAARTVSITATYAIASIIVTNTETPIGGAGQDLEVYIATTPNSGNNVIAIEDHIEYRTVLAPGESLERTGIFLPKSETIYVRGNGSHGAIRVHGLEFNSTNSFCQIARARLQEGTPITLGSISAADKFGTTNITMLNGHDSLDSRGTVNIVPSSVNNTPDPSTLVENKVLLPALGGGFNHTCLVLGSSEHVYVQSEKSDPAIPNTNDDVIVRVSSIVTINS